MPRPQVDWFAERMEEKLLEHDGEMGASGWRDVDPAFLMLRLQIELGELSQAMLDASDTEQTENVIWEAADVGAFAMMLADLYNYHWGDELSEEQATQIVELTEELRRQAADAWYGRDADGETATPVS